MGQRAAPPIEYAQNEWENGFCNGYGAKTALNRK
jgi:hypothetical protein